MIQNQTRRIDPRWILISILVVLILVTYRNWFSPGIIQYGDWTYFFNKPLLDYLSGPVLWNMWTMGYSMSVSTIFELMNFPLRFAQGILIRSFGVDSGFAAKILFFFPLPFLAAFSMYYLSYVLFKNHLICFFSSLLFTFNQYFLYWAEGGGITIDMATALAPLILAFFINGLRRNGFKSCIIGGLLFAISMFYELRVSYITFGIVAAYLSFDILTKIRFPNLKATCKDASISIVKLGFFLAVPLALSAFWILPSAFFGIAIPLGNNQPFWVRSTSLLLVQDALTLHSPWITFINPDVVLTPALYAIPIFVFFSILLKPKNAKVTLFSLLAIVFVFLAKGANPPFGDAYLWLFLHFPGFSAFREPSKFLSGASLAYAVLFGVTVVEIYNRTKRVNVACDFPKRIWKMKSTAISLAILIVMSMVALSGSQYVVLSDKSSILQRRQTGTLVTHSIPTEYVEIDNWFQSQPDYFRTLWIPTHPGYISNSQEHPGVSPYLGFPGLGYYFLSEVFSENLTSNLGKIYGLASIGYIIITPESSLYPLYLHAEPYVKVLDGQMDLEKFHIGENVTAYRNKSCLPHFYETSNSILLVGGKSTVLQLSPYINFSDWTMFFVDQLKSKSLTMEDQIDCVVFDNGKDVNDLSLALVGDEYRCHLWQYAKLYGYDDAGCWLRNFPVYDGSTYTYDGRGSFFEDNKGEIRESLQMIRAPLAGIDYPDVYAKMDIPREIETSEEYDIWLRLGVGSDYGRFVLQIDHESLQMDFSALENVGLKWVKLTTTFLDKGHHVFSLINQKGKNSFDELIVIPHDILVSDIAGVNAWLSQKEVVFMDLSHAQSSLKDFFANKNQSPPMEWMEIHPYEYQLQMKTNSSAFLVSSDAYDPNWVLVGPEGETHQPLIAWGGLTSFPVNQTGNFILEFPPQQSLELGVSVSVLSLSTTLVYLLIPINYMKKTISALRKRCKWSKNA